MKPAASDLGFEVAGCMHSLDIEFLSFVYHHSSVIDVKCRFMISSNIYTVS